MGQIGGGEGKKVRRGGFGDEGRERDGGKGVARARCGT